MLNIVTYNLRCVWVGDGVNSFLNRAGLILHKIDNEQPDIICFQEGVKESIAFMKKNLRDYYVAFNQRGENFDGEGLAVAFRRDKFDLLGLDCFWLSPTPYIPGSRFEIQSEYPRICQDVLLKRVEDGKLFRVYNIHLDHVSDEARVLGIEAVLNRVKEDKKRFDLPFFIFGDFNAEPDSKVIQFCNNYEAVPMKELTETVERTFHGYERENLTDCKIDYIFTDTKTAQLTHSAEIWKEKLSGVFLSDHYPVSVKIEF